ncbi:MAG TPA: acyl-CoA dehydrogenase family protein, partial [Acidimicrobiia bacterium]|nr:acyl-CoA dehydrogenase family protein [Acidimicrobiia bacterium]
MAWDFSTEPEFEEKLEWMRGFVRDELIPLETLDLTWEQFRSVIRPLQAKVKDAGLWAAHLSPELGGQGYGQVKLGLMHEILGACDLGPHVFGNQAPDSGNSELIALAGNEEQRERWLRPLLEGRIYSAFSMTEPGTGSDPRQFTSRAERDGDEWVLNGHKWFVSNASRSDFHIVVAVTNPDVHPYEGMSMFIVPTGSPGLELRELGTLNDPEGSWAVHNQAEVFYR